VTEKLTHPIVKAAIDALQAGDSEAWKELFDPDAVLLDDGHPRDLERFSDEAVGHERFASIDTVRDGGLKIEGEFQSDVWGRFRTYFHFTISDEGKIAKLEIGQA
jgi:hypothetical protein